MVYNNIIFENFFFYFCPPPGPLCEHDNSSIAKSLKVDKSWVRRVRKELEESEGDYEAITERPTHKQRTVENCRATAYHKCFLLMSLLSLYFNFI